MGGGRLGGPDGFFGALNGGMYNEGKLLALDLGVDDLGGTEGNILNGRSGLGDSPPAWGGLTAVWSGDRSCDTLRLIITTPRPRNVGEGE